MEPEALSPDSEVVVYLQMEREAAEKVDTTAYIWYNVIIKYRRWHYG
jgi:hypothetical protein